MIGLHSNIDQSFRTFNSHSYWTFAAVWPCNLKDLKCEKRLKQLHWRKNIKVFLAYAEIPRYPEFFSPIDESFILTLATQLLNRVKNSCYYVLIRSWTADGKNSEIKFHGGGWKLRWFGKALKQKGQLSAYCFYKTKQSSGMCINKNLIGKKFI